MEEVSGKLFSIPVMLAYNHFLQRHSAYSHCPGLGVEGWVYEGGGGGGRGSMNEKGKKFSMYLRCRVSAQPCICQAETCSAPILNSLRGLSTRVSILPPWVSNLPSQIQFPQWQIDNFRGNICSILSVCENPLTFTTNASSLSPQGVLGS
jgi:hypothetical protein